MLAGDYRIGEANEPDLLLSIAWGLVYTAESDLGEADVLRLPVGQRELEARTTPSCDGRW